MPNRITRGKGLFGSVQTDTLTVNGATVSGGVVLAASDLVDLNGEADALVLDADADTTISAPTDDQIDIEVAGADDFRITANTLTALSGSTIATNTIAETTAGSGVTIDGVLLKDSAVTGDVTGNITGNVTGNITGNVTGNVTGTLIGGQQDTVAVITGDGAITIAPSTVALTKGSAAAITLAAPTATTHDGYLIRVYSETAFQHVITSGVDGFNAKGSSGTITLGGAAGDAATLVARNGHWWVIGAVNAVVA